MSNIDYKLAKQLKDAGFPQQLLGGNWGTENAVTSEFVSRRNSNLEEIMGDSLVVYYPTLSELIDAVRRQVNEVAIGYHDSGCFWHFQYGERGAGNMIEGCGKKFVTDELELDVALAKLWLELNKK